MNEEDFNNSITNDMTYNKIKNSVISYQLLFDLLRTIIYNTPENN
ncbi:hypothetical protein, partial [Elizabethkingia anophelis]